MKRISAAIIIGIFLFSTFRVKGTDTVYNYQSLSPEQTITDYFKWLNEKNIFNANSLLTEERRRGTDSIDNLEYIKILDINEYKENLYKESYLKNGRGTKTHPMDLRVYIVTYEANYKVGSVESHGNGKHTWYYFVIKQNKNSPWLIDDWGIP